MPVGRIAALPRATTVGTLLLALLLWFIPSAWAQAAYSGGSQGSIALRQVLDDDGALHLPAGFQGPIDPSGFDLLSAPGKPLKFAPKNAGDDLRRWDTQFGFAIGCNGPVYALAAAGDGTLLVGGFFSLCGNVPASNVVRWNPQTGVFSTLGNGAAQGVDSIVAAIAVSGTDVFVGGYLLNAGGVAANRIARFDTTTSIWSALAGSGNGVAGVANPRVWALTAAGGVLYVGGGFTTAGGISANHVARYTIASGTWASLGAGAANGVGSCTSLGVSECVKALQVVGSTLYVGGDFTVAGGVSANRIARFDTSAGTWSTVGAGAQNGVNNTVYGLAATAGDVFVTGAMTSAGGTAVGYLARFNLAGGTWAPLGSGIPSCGFFNCGQSLRVIGSGLYLGGTFSAVSGTAASNVARYDLGTTAWSSLGSGAANGASNAALAFEALGSDVYVGGGFAQAGGVTVNSVARYNTGAGLWTPLGSGSVNGLTGQINAMAVAGNDIYVGGFFTQAGSLAVNQVARFNTGSNTWSTLGSGTSNGVNGVVYALALFGSDLLVGGNFSQAGGVAANMVARYNPGTNAFTSLGAGASNGITTGTDVRAFGVIGTSIYVGGHFTSAGGLPTPNLARFSTASGTWASATGTASGGTSSGVESLLPIGSILYVAGEFTTVGAVPANRVARLDTGSNTWAALGSPTNGVDNRAWALAATATDLYVGGDFANAGGAAANHVARYNLGSGTWAPLGTGTSNGITTCAPAGNGTCVFALALSGNGLFVGGNFSQAGTIAADNLARYDLVTGNWSPLGSVASNGVAGGSFPVVYALATANSMLDVGGSFAFAAGVPSVNLGRYDLRGNSEVVVVPASGTVEANTALQIDASVATAGFPGSTGTVRFVDGSSTIAGCAAVALTGGLDTRPASCVTSALAVGSHAISAVYAGDTLNFTGTSATANVTVIAPAIALAPTTLPNGLAGVTYSQTISASGSHAIAPFGYAVGSGAIPNGLTLLTNGNLSGNPTSAGDYTFTAVATDASSAAVGGPFSGSRTYTISVSLQTTSIAIGTITPEPSLVGQAYSVPVTVTGQVTTPNGVVSCSDGAGASDTKALSGGAATCSLTSSVAGPKTITVVYGVQGNFDASVQTKSHVVNNANQAPALGYTPVAGTTVALAGAATQLGDPASGQVAVAVTSTGTGTGIVSLGCSASGGNFQIGAGGSQSLNVGDTPVPVALSCARTAALQSGTLNCTETSTPGGAQRQLSWPLTCPAASAVPPTLTYDPTPGNAVVFPGGAANTPSNAAIQVSGAGAVGNGSTNLSCSIPPADTAFSIVGGNNQTVTASVGAVPLALRCNLSAIARSSTLTCTETDGPVVAQRSRSWPLNCPAGQASTSARLTVGSRTGTRGQTVAVPVSFLGEGTTYSVSAQLSFDNSRLTLRKLSSVGSASCTAVNDGQGHPFAVNVAIPNLGGALPAADTRSCELDLQVAANAPNGAIALTIGQANCLDAAQAARLCTKTDGRVAVAAMDPVPGDGAAITISGHVSDVSASYALFVSNRGSGNQTITNCALTTASGALTLAPTPTYPLTLTPQQRVTLTLGCQLPPLGQTLSGTLACSTDDPMRGLMSYPVICRAVADGEPLPADQLLNEQQRAGEQQGRSAAMATAGGTTLVALGAPFGGGDGNGRVALYESVATATKSAGGAGRALRLLASLEASTGKADGRAKALTALVTEALGQAVALRADGEEVAVGAPNAPVSLGGAAGAGRVYRYVRPAAGWSGFDAAFDTPTILEAPTAPGIATAGFGGSLAYTASGDLIVGAPGSTASSVSGAGAVFAYVSAGTCPGSGLDPRDGSACTPGASLFEAPVATSSPAAVGNGNFGSALATSSGAVFIGAPGEIASAIKPGNVYRVGYVAGTFLAPTRLAPTIAQATNDKFGSALAISGDLLFAGAPGADGAAGSDAGAVLVFKGLAAPLQVSTLLPAAGASQAAGSAIAANASVVYVGAPTWSSVSTANVGRVYAYPVKASYAATEAPTGTLDNATGQPGDDYGRALALGPDQAVIGVPKADETLFDGTALSDTGRADPFVFPKGDPVFADGFE